MGSQAESGGRVCPPGRGQVERQREGGPLAPRPDIHHIPRKHCDPAHTQKGVSGSIGRPRMPYLRTRQTSCASNSYEQAMS